MEYTISQLAKMAKVSVRTLHYYDQIDLLKPAYHLVNGYRTYGEKELLLLQQILFFRELGFELRKIKKILKASHFNQMAALAAHRQVLEKKRERMGELIVTIDLTMKHLKGEITMDGKDIYQGFDQEKQEEYEKYLADNYGAENLIAESKKRTKDWKKEEWDAYFKESDLLYKAAVAALEEEKAVDSEEVQQLMGRHFKIIELFYDPTKEVYIGLGALYNKHPDFRKFFDKYHPELAPYLAKAMEVYAEQNL